MECIGVDIGSEVVEVCRAGAGEPRSWRTEKVEKKGDWAGYLRGAYFGAGAVVALEPTGWHYALAVARVALDVGCLVVWVSNIATRSAREDRVASQKTDANDARALAVKARDYVEGRSRRGVRVQEPETFAFDSALRATVNARVRAVRDLVQVKNRFQQLAHGVWPEFGYSWEVYAKAVRAGAVFYPELVALASAPGLRDVEGFEAPQTRGALTRFLRRCEGALGDEIGGMRVVIEEQAWELQRLGDVVAGWDARCELMAMSGPIAEVTRLWMTIPNAGLVRLALIHSATRCNAAVMTADEFRAACGCHPQRHESGKMVEKKHERRGYKPAKGALHLWAVKLIQEGDNPVAREFARLKALHRPYAIHSARGKLCKMLSGMARTGSEFRRDAK